MLYIAIIFGIILLTFYYIQLPFKYWKNKNVPSPTPSYFFGNVNDVVLLKRSLSQLYHELYQKFPEFPYIGIYKSRIPCLLIRDPELIKDVLVKNFNSFHDNDIYVDEKYDPLFAKNAFTTKGQVWKEKRSQSTPSFTAKKIKEMYPLMERVCENLVDFLKKNSIGNPQDIDIKELCMKYTTDVVVSCALGLEANSFVNSKSNYIEMMKKISSPSITNSIKILFVFIFPSLASSLKLQIIPTDAAEYYRTIVGKTLEYRRKNKVQRGDFLDSMHELQAKLGSDSFTDDDVAGHAFTFLTDGVETSSIVMSFTLYEIGLHPDVQANLKNEIDEVLKKNEGKLSYDAIQDLSYLDQIINENVRKNTPVGAITRVCTEPCSLQSPCGNGEQVDIEIGTPVIIPVHSIHNDPKYYPNPSLFDPTRFSKDGVESRPKYTFLAFGEGPRICIGQRFAIGQIKAGIVNIIKNFEIKVNKSTTVPYEVDPHYFMLAAKGGIRLDFYPRA